MNDQPPIATGWFVIIGFAAILSIVVISKLLIGIAHGAEAKASPADCVSLYFQLCPNVPANESAVRACVEKQKSRFPPSCLELAKGLK